MKVLELRYIDRVGLKPYKYVNSGTWVFHIHVHLLGNQWYKIPKESLV